MMRKLPFIALMLLAILVLFGGCKRRSIITEMGLGFDTLRTDTTALLVDSTVSPRSTVHIELVTLRGDAYRQLTDSLLRSGVLQPDYLSLTTQSLTPKECVDSFMRHYVDDYREFYGNLFTEENDTSSLSIGYDLRTEIEEGRGDVLCHISHVTRREGKLSTTYTLVRNMDMKGNRILNMDDVFVAGYANALNEAIQNKLMDMAGVKSMNALREAGYFVNSEVYATSNFMLGEKKLSLIYVTGEIADRAKGEIRVDISYGDLKSILKQ